MADLIELAERVENGEGASRATDQAVWCALNGADSIDVDPYDSAGPRYYARGGPSAGEINERDIKPLTSSLDAVVALLGRVLPGWFWSADFRQIGSEAYVYRADRDVGSFFGRSKKPERALLAAILRALAVKEPS